MLILEIVVVLALFVLNGFFAMAELAIIGDTRSADLKQLIDVRTQKCHF
jgi:CBS domain containing-hemolysin-like protein